MLYFKKLHSNILLYLLVRFIKIGTIHTVQDMFGWVYSWLVFVSFFIFRVASRTSLGALVEKLIAPLLGYCALSITCL